MPPRFEAVAEALVAGADAITAGAVVGRELARDGVDLSEAFLGLRSTYQGVLGCDPPFEVAHAVGVAWGEETLGFVHQLSCEDPLTGLATLAHLRARLAEVYRGAEAEGGSAMRSHALLVVDLPPVRASPPAGEDRFEQALHLVRLTELIRLVLPEAGTLAALGSTRLLLLVGRDHALGSKVVALRDLIGGVGHGAVRIWIEGLPPRSAAAGRVLDELARR